MTLEYVLIIGHIDVTQGRTYALNFSGREKRTQNAAGWICEYTFDIFVL